MICVNLDPRATFWNPAMRVGKFPGTVCYPHENEKLTEQLRGRADLRRHVREPAYAKGLPQDVSEPGRARQSIQLIYRSTLRVDG